MRTLPTLLRVLCIALAPLLAGLTGFLHPVLCIEGDGRVRLEMDASECCASPVLPADPGAPASASLCPAGDCDACTDIHISTQGTRAPRLPLAAPVPSSAGVPPLPVDRPFPFLAALPGPPGSSPPTPPPLRC